MAWMLELRSSLKLPHTLEAAEGFDEAMAHPLISGFLEKLMREDVIPIVPPAPGMAADDYLCRIKTTTVGLGF